MRNGEFFITQKVSWRGSKPILAAAFALLSQILIASPAFAASESAGATMAAVASQVTERDGKYYLYKNGKPLNDAGYDRLDIEFPDLAETRLGSQYGVLDANTGELVLPFIYQSVRTETLNTIGLIEVRKDNLTSFVDSKGQPVKAPAYDVVADFNEAGQRLAERAGKFFMLTFRDGQLRSEEVAPQYLPSIILPPGLRQRPVNPDGPLNGTYVAASYPDLKRAWAAWRKGQLIEPAQPAIVVKGDIAYVSFGILADSRLPMMRNTMGVCQNEQGLTLFDTSRPEGCTSAERPIFRFRRERDGSLQCTDCYTAMQGKWLKLPVATQSLVGIGIAITMPLNSTGALVRAVIPGAPAELTGVKPGDRITMIDDRSTSAMSLNQITDLIRGQPATSVRLGIERETQRLELMSSARQSWSEQTSGALLHVLDDHAPIMVDTPAIQALEESAQVSTHDPRHRTEHGQCAGGFGRRCQDFQERHCRRHWQ
ncbi:PDZ domain-containing protein [Glaciimonas sp. GS1]|uniref:PDZ domain-containing protein n=2 Tax=Glaciimonas soli TaxID=2590999 RepID=A0A843YQC8_9BURK|nr:PDZ domain-containing protein [Glaciimonas soli]